MKASTRTKGKEFRKVAESSDLSRNIKVKRQQGSEYASLEHGSDQDSREKPESMSNYTQYPPRNKNTVTLGCKPPLISNVPHPTLPNMQQKQLKTRPKSTRKLEVKRHVKEQQYSTQKTKMRVYAVETNPKKGKLHLKTNIVNTPSKQKAPGIKTWSLRRIQRVSFSQRVLQNEQLLDQLARKYTDVQEELVVKCSDLLVSNSKFQSNTRVPSQLDEQVVNTLKASIIYWEQLENTLNIQVCCKVVESVAKLPSEYADFENYKWTRIVFLLISSLQDYFNQGAELHLKNLIGYCKSNYYFHLTNTILELQPSLETNAVLVLINQKQKPLPKRLQQINQNLVVIQSIATMLVDSYEQQDVKVCLLNQKKPGTFDKKFYKMWRGLGLYPMLPPVDQQHLYTLFVDLDNTLILRDQGTVAIRPFSKELLEEVYRQAQIILFTRLNTQQLQSVLVRLSSSNPFYHIVNGLEHGKVYSQTIQLLNRHFDKLYLISTVSYNRNSLVVNKWNGSEYDNQLMQVLDRLEVVTCPLHL